MKEDKNNHDTKVYTPDEVADMLAIGTTSVYSLLAQQMIVQGFRVLRVGKLYRIERSSFDRWLMDSGAGA